MSRNENRTGCKHLDENISSVEQCNEEEKQQEPKVSMNLAVMTEIVDLPSKGRFYNENHPLFNKETVSIKYLTAHEEDILNNRAFLRKGIAIDKMLQSVILDKSVKLDDLLICDKDAIVISARITGYGEEYLTKIQCPECGETNDYQFDLSKIKIFYGDLDKFNENKNVVIQLPKTKSIVECKLRTGVDEKEMAFLTEKKKKNNLPEAIVTDQLKQIIVSINGNSDRGFINNFVNNMPMIDSRFLRNEYQRLIPNIDLTQLYLCPFCTVESEVQVPIGPSFFWSK